jgi:hypothetical protein
MCSTVGNVGDELHRALRKQGHSGLYGLLQNTRLYKSGCRGWEHVGFALLRLCAGVSQTASEVS